MKHKSVARWVAVFRRSFASALLITAAFLALESSQAMTLVPVGATWKYLDTGLNQGTIWQIPGFNDSAWSSGPAELGYGDGGEATVVSYGSDASHKYTTTYYRYSFPVANRASITNLAVRLVRDDGGIVYLNGVEVFRSNMPDGTVAYDTFASTVAGGSDESAYFIAPIDPLYLVSGPNELAVEIHQCDLSSSDTSFNLELLANTSYGNLPPAVSFSSPTNGSAFQTNQVFSLVAMASDKDSQLSTLEFYEDGVLIRSFAGSGGLFSWSNAVPGLHTYTARALDAHGGSGTSAPVRIFIPRPNAQTVFLPLITNGDLTLQGNATIVSNWLRLTPNRTAQKSGAWLPAKRLLKDGFETFFQFRITDTLNGGADGFAFVIESTPSPMLGGGDNSLGFAGITNSLAVSFDTWVNPEDSLANDNHISIQSRGLLGNTGDAAGVLASNANIPDLSDRAIHTVKIEYVSNQMRVYLDNLASPIITLNINLSTYLSLENGTAWVGFTAATGAMAETHEIRSWVFSSFNDIPTVTLAGPTNGFRCLPGTNLSLTASLNPPGAQVTTVDFLQGTAWLGSVTSSPYTFVWTNIPEGVWSVRARATTRQGSVVSSAPIMIMAEPSGADLATYPDFSVTAGLIVQGDASSVSNRLRLTSARLSQAGGIWLNQKWAVKNGFETVFQFQVSAPYNGGADGFAFILQNGSSPLLGAGGRALGYGAVTNSLAVEFDVHANSEEAPISAPHTAIHTGGTGPNSPDRVCMLTSSSGVPNFLDGDIHTAKVRYEPGTLRVFLDDFAAPVLVLQTNLEKVFDLDEGKAWVGFTAATGAGWENHDILSWYFRSDAAFEIAQLLPQSANSMQLSFYTAVGRTYTVQFSTNLVDWQDAFAPVSGSGGISSWTDSGPPVTDSLPSIQRQRFYRVVVNY